MMMMPTVISIEIERNPQNAGLGELQEFTGHRSAQTGDQRDSVADLHNLAHVYLAGRRLEVQNLFLQ